MVNAEGVADYPFIVFWFVHCHLQRATITLNFTHKNHSALAQQKRAHYVILTAAVRFGSFPFYTYSQGC